MKRIGLFGGTFDPIHQGHLRAARDVKAAFDLETLYFIPSATPPHKPRAGMAEAVDRMAMIRKAVAGAGGLAVSDAELRRSGPSYTIDTVKQFIREMPPQTDLLFLLGLDAFLEIDTWKSYAALFELTSFVVMSRPGVAGFDGGRIERFMQSRIDPGYRLALKQQCLVHGQKCPVYLHAVRPVSISSTCVRSRIGSGKPICGLVPAAVEHYIRMRGLYR